MALAALSMDGLDVKEQILRVRLRTPDWINLNYLHITKLLTSKTDNSEKIPLSPKNAGFQFELEGIYFFALFLKVRNLVLKLFNGMEFLLLRFVLQGRELGTVRTLHKWSRKIIYSKNYWY